MSKCPRCGSPAPHLHPAMQFEGETETCPHAFHLKPSPQNSLEYINLVIEKQRKLGWDLVTKP